MTQALPPRIPAFAVLAALSVLSALAVLSASDAAAAGKAPRREIAVTIDDLPGVSVARTRARGQETKENAGGGPESAGADLASLERMTRRLLGTLSENRIPAVGFVNEGKLGPEGAPSANRVALLREWRRAGLELGNHTFGHVDFHRVSLAQFEEDVVRGEPVTRALMEETGGKLRWFRHPFLHTGTSLENKLALEAFLAGRGYRVAPVTIDNGEWIFARGYAVALDAGDRRLADRIRGAYVRYMESKLEYFERQSTALFGREVRQVLLVHANSLNADNFGEVVRMMRRRGYAIVSLDRALEDPAYAALPDTFTGHGGITWLHRWALSSGKRPLAREPMTPPFVLAAAGVDGE